MLQKVNDNNDICFIQVNYQNGMNLLYYIKEQLKMGIFSIAAFFNLRPSEFEKYGKIYFCFFACLQALDLLISSKIYIWKSTYLEMIGNSFTLTSEVESPDTVLLGSDKRLALTDDVS